MTEKIFLVPIPEKHDILLVCSDHCCDLHDTKPENVELTQEEIEHLKYVIEMFNIQDKTNCSICKSILKKLEAMR